MQNHFVSPSLIWMNEKWNVITFAGVDTALVSVMFETVLYSSGYVSSSDSNSLRNSIFLSYYRYSEIISVFL